MDIVRDTVKKLEQMLEHSGCADSGVLLDVNPAVTNCQFEGGACMTAVFGGKLGIFTTFDPIRACTKISFMFEAPLDTPATRGAACAIINVATGFFCLVRVLKPCDAAAHAPCVTHLVKELSEKSVFCHGFPAGTIPAAISSPDPDQADVILINGDGLTAEMTGDLVAKYRKKKRIICLGPSTTGISRMNELEHWCPFGR